MADEGDEDFMAELKREFKATINRNAVELPSLYLEGNFKEIRRIAHDIKGTAGLFELQKGAEIAMRLQKAAEGEDGANTQGLIEELIAYMKAAGIVEA